MLQPRTYSREATLTTLATTLNQLSLCARHAPKPSRPQLILVRHASHAQQGRANGPKDSAGRRLGAKKTASQWVIPGNIIFKQRGMVISRYPSIADRRLHLQERNGSPAKMSVLAKTTRYIHKSMVMYATIVIQLYIQSVDI